MSKVTVDVTLRNKLNGLAEQMQFCDESGRILGHFLPAQTYRELLNALADELFPPEDEDRIDDQAGGRPLVEIWKSLGRS